VAAAGGTATLSPDGSYSARPDVAIVVFGEEPYAEFVGDRRTLEFSPGDKSQSS
jgi:beta-glucosidase